MKLLSAALISFVLMSPASAQVKIPFDKICQVYESEGEAYLRTKLLAREHTTDKANRSKVLAIGSMNYALYREKVTLLGVITGEVKNEYQNKDTGFVSELNARLKLRFPELDEPYYRIVRARLSVIYAKENEKSVD